MKKSVPAWGALVAAILIAGCQTTSDQGRGIEPGAQVTRFHLGQPIARGEIRVEPADPGQAGSLEFAQTVASVERELGRLGWIVASGNARSEQVALVRVEQRARMGPRGGSGLSVGIGGGTGGYRSGVGVGATIPVGSGGAREIVTTELNVRIQRRSDATVAWEGRGELEARGDSPLAQRPAAVDRLVEALFRDFPGESGHTIRVE